MNNKIKNKKGITLIALVITIVVLAILAGVTINLVIGQEGIIQKAEIAHEKQDAVTANEQVGIAQLSEEADSYISGSRETTEQI